MKKILALIMLVTLVFAAACGVEDKKQLAVPDGFVHYEDVVPEADLYLPKEFEIKDRYNMGKEGYLRGIVKKNGSEYKMGLLFGIEDSLKEAEAKEAMLHRYIKSYAEKHGYKSEDRKNAAGQEYMYFSGGKGEKCGLGAVYVLHEPVREDGTKRVRIYVVGAEGKEASIKANKEDIETAFEFFKMLDIPKASGSKKE